MNGAGTLTVNQSGTTSYSGSISGNGGLVMSGTGTLTLSGTNNYTGGTTVSGGTLQGTTDSLQGAITNNAAVTFNQSTNGTYAGNMTGSGAVSLTGTGNVTFSGTNSYSGGTTVSAGTLTGTTNSLQGDITNNATVTFGQNTNGTYAGNLSGSGAVNLTGTGNVTFSGTNSYSGGTTVSAGTLTGTTDSLQGAITNNAAVVFSQATTGTYAGALTGTGTVAIAGGGTITLGSTASNYSGGTTVSGGSTLSIASNANIGTGSLTLGDATTAGTLATTATINTSRTVTLGAGGGTFNIAGGTSLSLLGSIGGSGGLTLNGGFLSLQGGASYTGGTTINAGTFQVSSNSALASTGALTVNGGSVQLSDGISQTISSLSGTGGQIVVNGSGTLTVNQSTNTTYGGTFGAGGTLIKNGSGTLTLTGTGAATQSTTVNAGTLQLGTGANLTSATVLTVNGGTFQFTGGSLGAGSTVAMAGGTFDLNSNSQTISELSGGSGAVTLGSGALTIDQSTNTSYAGTISDGGAGGSLVKQGTGTLTLSGANSYTGGTTVSAGTLSVSADNNLGATSGGLTLGNGSTLATTGSFSSSRAITLSGGGVIAPSSGTTLTLNGGIGGTGGLTMNGAGTLVLASGTYNYGGGTTVSAGRLTVNGNLASDVTVGTGGNFGGTGTVTGNVINNGTVLPDIGTLNIVGNYTQNAGSTYQVEVTPGGRATRSPSPAMPRSTAARSRCRPTAGTYARNTTYTILTATTGVTGTYTSVTSNFAFLTPSLTYDANDVFLTLLQNGTSAFSLGARTINQRAVGAALDRVGNGATGDLASVLNVLYGLDTVQGPKALDTLSGQQYADFGTTNLRNGQLFMNAVGQQMRATHDSGGSGATRVALAEACEETACGSGPGSLSSWISGLGGVGAVQGDGNASTLTYNAGGTAMGLDYRIEPRVLVGFGVGYLSGTQWVDSFTGQGNSDTFTGTLYGSFAQGAVYLDGSAGYANSNNRMTRVMAIPGLATRIAQGQSAANQFMGQLEGGYKLMLYERAAVSLTPFARLQGATVSQAALSETGANALNLSVASQTTNSLVSTLGVDLKSAFPTSGDRKLDMDLRLGWAHENADTTRPITAAFAGAPGNNFTVFGATPSRDSAALGLGVQTHIAEMTEIYARYDGDVSAGNNSNHAFSAGLRMTW